MYKLHTYVLLPWLHKHMHTQGEGDMHGGGRRVDGATCNPNCSCVTFRLYVLLPSHKLQGDRGGGGRAG